MPVLHRGNGRSPWRYTDRRVKCTAGVSFAPKVPFTYGDSYKLDRDSRRRAARNQAHDILGPLFEHNAPVLTDGSFQSFLAAFNKRVNYHSDERCHVALRKGSKALMLQTLPETLAPIEWTRELFEKWNSQFHPAKQKRMIKALDNMNLYRDSEFAAKEIFEKVELLMKRHDPAWAGRIVNSSSDLHNCISGPIISECLKRLVQAFGVARDSGKNAMNFTIAYGEDPQSFVRHIDGDGPFIEADFSSNDKLQVADVVQLEAMWAERLGMPSWLAGCLMSANHYQVINRRFGLSAKVKNQLPSGSTSTTFRNSIWNSTIFFTFGKRFGLKSDTLILGDDMLSRMRNGRIPRRAARQYEHVAKLARMSAKVKVNTHLVQCEFLSRRFVPSAYGHRMLPKLGKAFGRFNARGNNTDLSDNLYVAGKSLSYAYEFRYYPPICRLFLERFLGCNVDMGEVRRETLSYNLKLALGEGSLELEAARLYNVSDPIPDDDFCAYSDFHYGKWRTEVLEDLTDLLFGNCDLSIERCQSYLQVDVW
nr:RNA dependent RNA polymerase [Erysiphe necator associated abispo virus 3]